MKIAKRILMILPDLNPCGVTSAAVNFCNGFAERGGQVDLLLMSDCSDVSQRGLARGIRVLRLKGTARWWNLSSDTVRKTKNPFKKACYLFLGGCKRLANRKNRWNALVFRNKKHFKGYDAAVAYRQSPACYRFALRNVEAARKVAFVHGELPFMGNISAWQPYVKEFDAVAFVSDGAKTGFLARYPAWTPKAFTVYNTVLPDEILRLAQLPCPMAFDSDRLNLVTVSYVQNTAKGTGRIPSICQKLKERYPNRFHWYVVGDGPDLAKCQRKAEKLDVTDHLTFLGACPNPFHYLSQADLCVFPTVTEAYPLILPESLTLGVPVIVSRYSAAEEMLSDGQTGLIAEQNSDAIFQKISSLFEDPALLAEFKKNCAAYRHDNDRSYRQFLDAIE